MKHLHMLMAVLTIVLFLYQSYLVLSANRRAPKAVNSHAYLCACHRLRCHHVDAANSANAPVQWVFAKVILLIAAISTSIKPLTTMQRPSKVKRGF